MVLSRSAGAIINYGAGVGHLAIRKAVMHDELEEAPTGAARDRAATDAELDAIRRELREDWTTAPSASD